MTTMGPPKEPCASSSSRKRKQPDEEEKLHKSGVLMEDPIENEYENLDDDDEDLEQEVILSREKTEFQYILKAQEPSTITQYGDIKVTGYNLEDEKEDGEFDEMGNFIIRKSSPTDDELNDTWADSVDWSAVERREREAKERSDQISAQNDKQVKPELVARDRFTCYRQMLRIMRPDETVQNTIRRIGNEVPKRRPINRNKSKVPQSSQPSGGEEARKKLDLMIELAHHLLEDGDTDIYQKSYEDLEEAINRLI